MSVDTLPHRLFAWVWRRWLPTGYEVRVVRITGWRSCLYDTEWGQRVRAHFLVFPWEKHR